MKCPICGQQLRPGKKDPNYLLCYNCKKKFKAPQEKAPEETEQKYSNIPPKHVRKKREDEMRKANDELLTVEDGKKKKMMCMMMNQCPRRRSLSLELRLLLWEQ